MSRRLTGAWLPGLAAALCVAALAAQDDPAKMPPALVAFEHARRQITGGRVVWEMLPEGDERRGLTFVSRYAKSGDMITEHRGDPDGWTVFADNGTRGILKYPQLFLDNADGYWHATERAPGSCLSATWWKGRLSEHPNADSVKDVRWLGLTVSAESVDVRVAAGALHGDELHRIVSWEEREVDDLRVVTGHTADGGRLTWYINPSKDWNAELIQYESKSGAIRQEAYVSLKRYGGVWFPASADFFINGQLNKSVRIREAELNPPDSAKRFTLADLGVEAGAMIAVPNGRGEKLRWNGEDICSSEQWYADLESGRRQWGPTHRRRKAGEEVASPYETEENRLSRQLSWRKLMLRLATDAPRSMWAKYVRDFVARYELDAEQTQQALRILDQCEKQAEEFTRRHRPAIEEAQNDLENAREKRDADAVARLEERINTLREPLNKIFETELKPRLEKLPTRAQRAKAEARDAAGAAKAVSQPSP